MSETAEAGRKNRATWLLETTLRRIRGTSGNPAVAGLTLTTRDPHADTLRTLASAGLPCPGLDELVLPLAGLPGLEFDRSGGRFHAVHDVHQLTDVPPHLDALLQAGFRSSLTAPLRGGGQVDGVLFVSATAPDAFDDATQVVIAPVMSEAIILLHREITRPFQGWRV
jgi:GAF domain-containing protein